mmetsp:Transcript_28152/g.69330  ORF Transcript_28152/g.69330 Transcript_28152/m.69330 type:complete len:121 (-) Transcript_28152:31-393(-)
MAGVMCVRPCDSDAAADIDGKKHHDHRRKLESQQAEEAHAFMRAIATGPQPPSSSSYSLLTTGIKRFLGGQKGKSNGHFVSLLNGSYRPNIAVLLIWYLPVAFIRHRLRLRRRRHAASFA